MVVIQRSDKRLLCGSESRDKFKRRHKDFAGNLYATDADLVLISKAPPGIVAYTDYKTEFDDVTFAEAICYNEWAKTHPVYLIIGRDPEQGPFDIWLYEGADWRPEPPIVTKSHVLRCETWEALIAWEKQLRHSYSRLR